MKDKIDGYQYYRNYHEIIRYLPDKERLKAYDMINDYMFDDIIPTDLKGILRGIFINLKMPLDTSKKNILNGKKGGRPKKKETKIITETITHEESPKETEEESELKPKHEPKPKANNISTFYFLISNFIFLKNKNLLRNKLNEWIKYKWERKEYYKETGFNSLLNKVEKQVNKHGEQKVIDLIDDCMANNYSGIIWDKLEPIKKTQNYKGMTSQELDEWERQDD